MKRTSYFIIGIPIVLLLIIVSTIVIISSVKVKRNNYIDLSGPVTTKSADIDFRHITVERLSARNLNVHLDSLLVDIVMDNSLTVPEFEGPKQLIDHLVITNASDTMKVTFDMRADTTAIPDDAHYWYLSMSSPEKLTIRLPHAPESFFNYTDLFYTWKGFKASDMKLGHDGNIILDSCAIERLNIVPMPWMRNDKRDYNSLNLTLINTRLNALSLNLNSYNAWVRGGDDSFIGQLAITRSDETDSDLTVGVNLPVGNAMYDGSGNGAVGISSRLPFSGLTTIHKVE